MSQPEIKGFDTSSTEGNKSVGQSIRDLLAEQRIFHDEFIRRANRLELAEVHRDQRTEAFREQLLKVLCEIRDLAKETPSYTKEEMVFMDLLKHVLQHDPQLDDEVNIGRVDAMMPFLVASWEGGWK
jgi:hypothetical protein